MALPPALGAPQRLSQPQVETIAFAGGLDQETPDALIRPGLAREALNFEVDSGGGYSRIGGTTRVITGQRPPWEEPVLIARVASLRRRSDGTALPDNFDRLTTLTGARVLRWGASSGSTLDLASTEGVLVAGVRDGSAWVVILRIVQVNASLNSYPPPAGLENLGTDSSGRNELRVQFLATGPGVASPELVAWLRKEVAADRNRQASTNWSAGLTANRLHGSFYLAGALWFVAQPGAAAANVLSPHPNNTPMARVAFSAGTGTIPLPGATVTQGAVSGTLHRAVARLGTWAAGNAQGELLLTGVTGGTFGAGAITIVGGSSCTGSATPPAAGTIPAPHQDARACWFSAATGTLGGRRSAFFAAAGSGAGSSPTVFEFDGTAVVPITSSPLNVAGVGNIVCVHANRLWISQGDRLVCSSNGDGHRYVASEGSIDLRVNGEITNLVSMVGAQDSAPLLVTTTAGAFMLYGTGAGPAPLFDWNLVPVAPDTPAARNTAALLGQDVMFWSPPHGVVSLRSMQSFGNFEQGTVTRNMTPWIEPRRTKAIGATAVLSRDQYRVFFSDGTALHVTIAGGRPAGAMPARYAGPFVAWVPEAGGPVQENEFPAIGGGFRHVQSGIDSSGVERTIACSGVQPLMLDQGGFLTDPMSTSEAGDPPPIQASLVLPFTFARNLSTRKQFTRAALHLSTPGFVALDASFGVDQQQPPAGQQASAVTFPPAGAQWPTIAETGISAGDVRLPLTAVGQSLSLRLATRAGAAVQGTVPCWPPFRLQAAVIRYLPRRESLRL